MGGLGYQRSSKKCKEKFENIYKYHRRTKEGRAMKKDGKNYRFSDQLEALDHHHINYNHQIQSPEKLQVLPPVFSTMTTAIATNPTNATTQNTLNPRDFGISTSTTSSSSSGEEESEGTRKIRKRKMETFFENLMKDVIQKQENLQKKFLEVMERREHERMVREEAWKMQELARINREHEILAQERAIAAARDSAVIAFLNNITSTTEQLNNTTRKLGYSGAQLPAAAADKATIDHLNTDDQYDHQNSGPSATISSNRWPKSEVEALIKLRRGLDRKYSESSSAKGPLWEEISGAMKKLGYNRSAKKCKEKWENINKYFKKVKESNKRRPEDSKTCPYYDQLDAIYKEKMMIMSSSPSVKYTSSTSYGSEDIAMQIMNKQEHQQQQQQLIDDDNDDDDDDDDDDDGDEDEASGYQIAVNNDSSMAMME